jgi:uncharacterized protein (DUF433 family)
MQIDYKKYIEADPNFRFGKPVLRGTRITVYDVLQWLASGITHKQIMKDFPQIDKDQIAACEAYAKNQAETVKTV